MASAAIPCRFNAPAQSLKVASAALTFASGDLSGWFGLSAFLAMAALCALALPLTPGLRRTG